MAVTAAHVLFVATLILTMFGFRFFNKWKETELEKEILEKEKATVQYDNLKNQLNPHFLFNSLTSLNSSNSLKTQSWHLSFYISYPRYIDMYWRITIKL
jgi:hypothetical protein